MSKSCLQCTVYSFKIRADHFGIICIFRAVLSRWQLCRAGICPFLSVSPATPLTCIRSSHRKIRCRRQTIIPAGCPAGADFQDHRKFCGRASGCPEQRFWGRMYLAVWHPVHFSSSPSGHRCYRSASEFLLLES